MMSKLEILSPWIVLLTALSACASGGGGADRGRSDRAAGSAFDLAQMLAGRYRAEAEGIDLRLDVGTGETLSGQAFDLFVTAWGKAGERNLRERAVVRLQNEGRDVLVAVIPRFDPTASELSPRAGELSQREISEACTFYMVPFEQGYAGETRGAGPCVPALGGAAGQWTVEVQPGTIRLIDRKDRQTVVFREVED